MIYKLIKTKTEQIDHLWILKQPNIKSRGNTINFDHKLEEYR